MNIFSKAWLILLIMAVSIGQVFTSETASAVMAATDSEPLCIFTDNLGRNILVNDICLRRPSSQVVTNLYFVFLACACIITMITVIGLQLYRDQQIRIMGYKRFLPYSAIGLFVSIVILLILNWVVAGSPLLPDWQRFDPKDPASSYECDPPPGPNGKLADWDCFVQT